MQKSTKKYVIFLDMENHFEFTDPDKYYSVMSKLAEEKRAKVSDLLSDILLIHKTYESQHQDNAILVASGELIFDGDLKELLANAKNFTDICTKWLN